MGLRLLPFTRHPFDLHRLALVLRHRGTQVRFLGRFGRGWGGELLDGAFGILGGGGGDLIGAQLAQVEVLHEVGCLREGGGG